MRNDLKAAIEALTGKSRPTEWGCGIEAGRRKGTMTMPDTEDYIVFDRTGMPHVVVAVKTEIGRWKDEGLYHRA